MVLNCAPNPATNTKVSHQIAIHALRHANLVIDLVNVDLVGKHNNITYVMIYYPTSEKHIENWTYYLCNSTFKLLAMHAFIYRRPPTHNSIWQCDANLKFLKVDKAVERTR